MSILKIFFFVIFCFNSVKSVEKYSFLDYNLLVDKMLLGTNMIKNRVREIRKMRKMTLEELAERLNVSYSAIQKLDAGTVDLDTQWMRKLAVVLDVEPFEFLPLDMQPQAVTPEEMEILRMIRKTTTSQTDDNKPIPQTTEVEKHTTQQSQPSPKSNER